MLVALLIILGGALGLVSAAIATDGVYPGPLGLLLSATVPPSLMYSAAVASRLGWRRWHRRPRHRITTGRELILWIIVIITTVGLAAGLYGNPAQRPRSAKAQADARALVSAVSVYRLETGRLPDTLADLTRPVKAIDGREVGPFLLMVPASPSGWLPYRYEQHGDGTFSIQSRDVDHEVRVLGPRDAVPRPR